MKFDVLTLFPEMFDNLKQSIIGRAQEKELIEINTTNIRDFSKNKHKKVDDTPYGGGAGMVMMPDVVYDAYQSVKTDKAKVIYMSPQGKKLDQKIYRHHSGYIGGMKETSARVMMDNTPEKAMMLAIKGMLPHTKLGRQMIKKLRVYAGSEHENIAQKPEVWEVK